MMMMTTMLWVVLLVTLSAPRVTTGFATTRRLGATTILKNSRQDKEVNVIHVRQVQPKKKKTATKTTTTTTITLAGASRLDETNILSDENQNSNNNNNTQTDAVAALQPQASSTSSSSNSNRNNNKGYRFGDLTRRVLGTRVQQLTGKDEYEFGDLTRWVDRQVKQGVNTVTGRDEYQWGDLSAWAWQQVNNATLNYTGKETYNVGDISKEVLRRVQSGEYRADDVWLACRILLSAGVSSLTPVVSLLPLRTLLTMINMGLTQEASGRLVEIMANALDRRVKRALTGDENYQLGDKTTQALANAVTRWTGKDNYQMGDITRTVQEKMAASSNDSNSSSNSKVWSSSPQLEMEERTLQELDEWDAKFLSRKAE